jgi:hypothetical protein
MRLSNTKTWFRNLALKKSEKRNIKCKISNIVKNLKKTHYQHGFHKNKTMSNHGFFRLKWIILLGKVPQRHWVAQISL